MPDAIKTKRFIDQHTFAILGYVIGICLAAFIWFQVDQIDKTVREHSTSIERIEAQNPCNYLTLNECALKLFGALTPEQRKELIEETVSPRLDELQERLQEVERSNRINDRAGGSNKQSGPLRQPDTFPESENVTPIPQPNRPLPRRPTNPTPTPIPPPQSDKKERGANPNPSPQPDGNPNPGTPPANPDPPRGDNPKRPKKPKKVKKVKPPKPPKVKKNIPSLPDIIPLPGVVPPGLEGKDLPPRNPHDKIDEEGKYE